MDWLHLPCLKRSVILEKKRHYVNLAWPTLNKFLCISSHFQFFYFLQHGFYVQPIYIPDIWARLEKKGESWCSFPFSTSLFDYCSSWCTCRQPKAEETKQGVKSWALPRRSPMEQGLCILPDRTCSLMKLRAPGAESNIWDRDETLRIIKRQLTGLSFLILHKLFSI